MERLRRDQVSDPFDGATERSGGKDKIFLVSHGSLAVNQRLW